MQRGAAAEYCHAMGATLASIRSQEERDGCRSPTGSPPRGGGGACDRRRRRLSSSVGSVVCNDMIGSCAQRADEHPEIAALA